MTRSGRSDAGARRAGEGKVPAAGKGDPAAEGVRAGVPAAAAGGLRYREIGEVLGIPTSTVGDTVDRAIKKLAEKCNV